MSYWKSLENLTAVSEIDDEIDLGPRDHHLMDAKCNVLNLQYV